MFEYTPLPQTIRYDLPSWPGFYVLIVPNKDATLYNFYLTHDNFGVIHEMFGWPTSNPDTTTEKLVELAHWNAPDYMAEFVRDCNDDE